LVTPAGQFDRLSQAPFRNPAIGMLFDDLAEVFDRFVKPIELLINCCALLADIRPIRVETQTITKAVDRLCE